MSNSLPLNYETACFAKCPTGCLGEIQTRGKLSEEGELFGLMNQFYSYRKSF